MEPTMTTPSPSTWGRTDARLIRVARNTGLALTPATPEGIQMRELLDHKVNGLNEAIRLKVLDDPGAGGACHEYEIDIVGGAPDRGGTSTFIQFQNGPVGENGPNGCSNESLLAIVIDRLRGFQSDKFACRENAVALTKCEEALMWLQKRTRDRMQRGVEGTNQR